MKLKDFIKLVSVFVSKQSSLINFLLTDKSADLGQLVNQLIEQQLTKAGN